ncbi:MAG: hypothetical protein FWG03_10605 [Clostridiales bacterium]|nr:hypothetical protein [Clostridiales bacterium]
MRITAEKIERLMDRADVSYETAKEALEAENGDIIEAVIALEREGRLGPGAGRNRAAVYATGGSPAATAVGQSYGSSSRLPQTQLEPNFTIGKDTTNDGAGAGKKAGGGPEGADKKKSNGAQGGGPVPGYGGAGGQPGTGQSGAYGQPGGHGGASQSGAYGQPGAGYSAGQGGSYGQPGAGYGQPGAGYSTGHGSAYGQPGAGYSTGQGGAYGQPGGPGYGAGQGGAYGQPGAGYSTGQGGAGQGGAYGQPGGYGGTGQSGGQGQARGPHRYKDETTAFEDNVKRFFRWLGRVLRASVFNYFEIWRKGERIVYFPVVLFLFCLIHWVFWVVLALLVIGLFCGCRYRFSGPNLGRKGVNDAMDKASKMAEDIKEGKDRPDDDR